MLNKPENKHNFNINGSSNNSDIKKETAADEAAKSSTEKHSTVRRNATKSTAAKSFATALNKKNKHISKIIWMAFTVLFALFFILFNRSLEYLKPGDMLEGIEYSTGRVVKIENDTLAPDPAFPYINIGRQNLTLIIQGGKYNGQTVTAVNFIERGMNSPAKIGTRMVLSSYDGFFTAMVIDYNREPVIYTLLAVFLGLLVWFGRKKGAKSIYALAFTLCSIIFFFIPMTIRGVDAIIAAVIVAVMSTVVSLFSLNGWSKKSFISSISCALCTLASGIIALIAGAAAHINTLNTAEAELLLFISQDTNLQIHHLFFAGIIFATLGAVTDTSMSITSAIVELKEVNPSMSSKELYRSGMNIGRDVMGTMTDTLILAFTGSSINLFVMFYMYQYRYTYLINMQSLVVELIQGLSGSIAVVLSVPVSALLAVRFIRRDTLSR